MIDNLGNLSHIANVLLYNSDRKGSDINIDFITCPVLRQHLQTDGV